MIKQPLTMPASSGEKSVRTLVLFILRLFLYLSAPSLVFFHPGIVVSYAQTGLILWFVIIPFEGIVAFLPPSRVTFLSKLAFGLLPLSLFSVYAGGFGGLLIFGAGLVSFVLTLLLFWYPRWGKLSVLEPFFLAWVCFQLLAFSRSGEEASGQSMGVTQIILLWTILVFLFHSVVIYFCLYPQGIFGAKNEAGIFGLVSAAALVLVIFLPPDFIRNEIVINVLPERIEEKTKPDDNEWGIPKDGGGRTNGRRTVPGGQDRDGRQPGLRGLSEYDWPSEEGNGKQKRRGSRGGNSGENSEPDQQYTVMVAASKQYPLYMGDSFRGLLDPIEGFQPTPEEPLNQVPSMRFFTTWFNNEFVFDRDRERQEVYSLSTLSKNFLPYLPIAVEPTILSEGSGPLRYIHRVRSDMYGEDPLELLFSRIRDLTEQEKNDLALYLEAPLEEADSSIFVDYLNHALELWREQGNENNNRYMEKILAILTSFRDYQYHIYYNEEDTSIAAIKEFLLTIKTGDCTEFSNAAAILGRLAGIPSRIVTGYLASNRDHTVAHWRGLVALRSKIKALQNFPLEELCLVTNTAAHSWVQFYVPDYGWLDFEATRFAIPPVGLGDGNLLDVVIPLIDENRTLAPVRSFPWRAVLQVMAILGAGALAGAYGLRYVRELLLNLGIRRGGRAGARSLYLLLLARLAAEGNPIKPASKTASEYAQLFPHNENYRAFAALYTELRWREFKTDAERDERFQRLQQEYQNVVNAARRPGIQGFFIRIFSLRGLAYL
ncbi:MAG: transglutaminase family protein [Treponema sp.]|jgi:transglutaminase-like putative cysteine protease|nr:transglutaminase family protein [Treponema sp.]